MAKKQTPPTLAEQIAAAEAELQAARANLDPADESAWRSVDDATAKLAALIEKRDRRTATTRDMQRDQQNKQLQSEQAANEQKRQDAAARIKVRSAEKQTLASKIVDLLRVDLRDMLLGLDVLNAEDRGDIAILRQHGGNERAAQRLANAGRCDGLLTTFSWALHDSGIGKVGVTLHPYVSITPASTGPNGPPSVADVFKFIDGQLDSNFNELFGLDEPEPKPDPYVGSPKGREPSSADVLVPRSDLASKARTAKRLKDAAIPHVPTAQGYQA